jgi:predicted GIY-YIG superfamily endonuclease
MVRKYIVYGLYANGHCFYVGSSEKTPERRLAKHLSAARSGTGYRVHQWINAYVAVGTAPTIEVFEVHDTREAAILREMDLTRSIRESGQPLANKRLGHKWMPDDKAKLSAKAKKERWGIRRPFKTAA